MEKNIEVNIAFRIWSQINQLESILWDRYRTEFLNLTIVNSRIIQTTNS